MENTYNIRIPHQYDLETPDAELELYSSTGNTHILKVWQARGSRRWVRIGEYLRAPGHPEFPHGHALFLGTDRDVVIPLYTSQVDPISWSIAVHFNEGGEQKVYQFKTRKEALRFQSFITGYDVAAAFQNIELVAVHHHEKVPWYKLWKKAGSKPELSGMGEIQIWQKKAAPNVMSPKMGNSPTVRSDDTSMTSGVRRVTTAATIGTVSRQADAVTVVTNANGTQLAIGTRPIPPVLVAFIRNSEDHYVMLKADCKLA
jgi:hypothetical protein